MKTEFESISGIMYTLLAHQPVIDVPYEKINDIAIALVKEGYGDISEYKAEIEWLKKDYAKLQEQFTQYQMASDKEIMAQRKQAKIDVLKELKTHSYYDDDYMDSYVFVSDIDELIKEIEE